MKPATKKVATKTRWYSGTNCKRLIAVISDWDNKSDTALDANSDLTLNWRQVAIINRIPAITFYHYTCSDLTKRRLLGGTSCWRRLMEIEDINTVRGNFARFDCANTRMDPRDARAFVRDVDPIISKE